MSFAYLRLYTVDYLRDTRHLTPLKHGIYLLLLMHCWDQKGPVPLDEQEAGGISNCRSADEIESLRYILDRYFIRMEDGWYNKRMAEEVTFADHIAQVSSEGGKRSAQIRKARSEVRKASRIEGTLKGPSRVVEGALVSPSPSPSPSSSLEVKTHSSTEPSVPSTCPQQEIVALWKTKLPGLRPPRSWGAERQRHLAARWRELLSDGEFEDRKSGLEWFGWFFDFIGKSPFLTGRMPGAGGRPPFMASLDWVVLPTNFAKIIDRNYHQQKAVA